MRNFHLASYVTEHANGLSIYQVHKSSLTQPPSAAKRAAHLHLHDLLSKSCKCCGVRDVHRNHNQNCLASQFDHLCNFNRI